MVHWLVRDRTGSSIAPINYFVFSQIVLCSLPRDDDPYNNKEIHIFMQSLKTNQENFVEIYAEWKNIAINLDQSKTFNITSKSPATGKKHMP